MRSVVDAPRAIPFHLEEASSRSAILQVVEIALVMSNESEINPIPILRDNQVTRYICQYQFQARII